MAPYKLSSMVKLLAVIKGLSVNYAVTLILFIIARIKFIKKGNGLNYGLLKDIPYGSWLALASMESGKLKG